MTMATYTLKSQTKFSLLRRVCVNGSSRLQGRPRKAFGWRAFLVHFVTLLLNLS